MEYRAAIVVCMTAVVGRGAIAAQGACGTAAAPCLMQELRPVPGDGAGFGTSIDVEGDLMVVGAPLADPPGQDPARDAGAVFPFHWDGYAWIAEEPLYLPLVPAQCPAGTCLSGFGQAVSIGGDRLLVGATRFGYANCDLECSAAFAYRRENLGWVFEAQLPYPAGEPYAETQFGIAVATDGQFAAVGDRSWPDPPDFAGYDIGRVFLYRRDGACWNLTSQAYLDAPGGHTGHFGSALSMDAGRLAVGAPRYMNLPQGQSFWSGAVFVYELDSIQETWALKQSIGRPASEDVLYFGYDVSLEGARLAVSAILTPGATREGTVYVHGFSSSAWSLEATLTASDGEPRDEFGWRVRVQGDNLLVATSGDRFDGPDAIRSPGGSAPRSPSLLANSAYLFQRSGGAWIQVAKIKPYTRRGRLQFAQSIALHGAQAVIGSLDTRNPRHDMVSAFAFGGADCNANGVPDACDIFAGTSADSNDNHVPDECDG